MESGLLFSFKIVFWLTETDSAQPVPRLPPPNVLVDHVLCDSVLYFNEAFVMPGRLPFGHFNFTRTYRIGCETWATTVRALWLATKRVRFCCNDLALLAGCPGHGQSVFNFIVDIQPRSVGSCQKRYPLTSVTWLYRGLKCTTPWDDVFFKVIRWTFISFNWSQAQDKKFSLSKKLCLVVSSASLGSWTRPRTTS